MRSTLFFILAFLSLSVLFSCGKSKSSKGKDPQEKAKNGSKESLKLDPEKDFIELLSNGKTSESAEFVKKALKDTAQISAKASLENILLHFNESEIEDDLMVFGLESDLNKNLSLELIAENAQSYKADKVVSIPAKLVFKAVKLNKLKAGKYYFILRDDTGNELVRKIKISHRK
jgi:hypothetical protein